MKNAAREPHFIMFWRRGGDSRTVEKTPWFSTHYFSGEHILCTYLSCLILYLLMQKCKDQ